MQVSSYLCCCVLFFQELNFILKKNYFSKFTVWHSIIIAMRGRERKKKATDSCSKKKHAHVNMHHNSNAKSLMLKNYIKHFKLTKQQTLHY